VAAKDGERGRGREKGGLTVTATEANADTDGLTLVDTVTVPRNKDDTRMLNVSCHRVRRLN